MADGVGEDGAGPEDPLQQRFHDLSRRLRGVFARGVEAELADDEFDELALAAFGYQFEANRAYAGFARGRGITPGTVRRWVDVPAVPTRAFKEVRLVSGSPAPGALVFRTSGTTGGHGRRGEHHVIDPGLYRASLLPNFRAHLLPEGGRLPIVSLVPSPEEAPDSSLSFMVGAVMEAFGAPGSACWVDASGAVDLEGSSRALRRAEEGGEPVLLVGTAFAMVHWLDGLEAAGVRFGLPRGSRAMETGGFKGRAREIPREELYARVEDGTGIDRDRIVNEYGMTEMLSQFYEPVLLGLRERVHRPPPWVRTRVLDPVTLDPAPEGQEGILCHFDLANLGSVCPVLTEDVGVAAGVGFRVLGRHPGSEPRGCSLAMDDLMSAAEEA